MRLREKYSLWSPHYILPLSSKNFSQIIPFYSCLLFTVQMNIFAGRNRDADVENGRVDIEGEGKGGMNWEIRIDICTLPCVK